MKRDTQRGRVYKAERCSLSGDMTLHECAEFAQFVCKKAKRDLYKLFPDLKITTAGRKVKVKDGRRRRRPCFDPSEHSIKLPRWGRSKQVVCHEVAHAYQYHLFGHTAWHGREFAGIYLILVKHGIGEEESRALRRRFCDHNVDFKC